MCIHPSYSGRVFLRDALGGVSGPEEVLLCAVNTRLEKGPEYDGICKKGTFLDPIYDIQDLKHLILGGSINGHISTCSHL